ncbi:abortive infection family protein [Paracoccus sp. SCSIO 75233]|uniref:abortive infection family protein n=1 Tax=Paracoccus sp. SCSIO 75233 TaxID=3017782 RepID=UPI0022F064D5|nr:abortive infection family protein [Paracoccus sp. SCSIO 75233]WBU53580.1 abortive infection family protein [Paracoccus sp. SCSIO 75233]
MRPRRYPDRRAPEDIFKDIGQHQDIASNDLKKIASGLNSIVDGTMFLRNKKSASHGRTEAQIKANELRPRHARLVIHSAHTLATYVLECMAGTS